MLNLWNFCLAGFLALGPACALSTNVPNQERFERAMQKIHQHYVHKESDNKLWHKALKGMVDELDPHSTFFDPQALDSFKQQTKGDYVGVGIKVTQENKMIKVISPLDGSPAAKANIKAGDYIIAVDKDPIIHEPLSKVVQKIRGKPDTQVTLTLIRKQDSKPRQVTLTRQEIDHPSVKSKMVTPHVGKIRISQFQLNTPKQTKQAIQDLQNKSDQLKGVVFDLRNNPGGLLKSAVKTIDLVLNSNKLGDNTKILYTQGRQKQDKKTFNADPGDLLKGTPIVVLINNGSASGAEIMAGALQDHHRALIMGQRSFGKGSVQSLMRLDKDTAIKLTTALFFTPNGHELQAEGIQPDIVIPHVKVKLQNNSKLAPFEINEKALKHYLANTEKGDKQGETSTQDLETRSKELTDLAQKDYELYNAIQSLKALNWQQSINGPTP